jgi:superfamily II DNA or RNA helicase
MDVRIDPTEAAGEPLIDRFAAMAFRWPFRRYQQLALDAFEAERAAGSRNAYLVMPPGAGKTALGLEIGRRLGQPILVLCPNTAVQAQWLRQWADFQPALAPSGASTDLDVPVTALTYQALCILDDEDNVLDERDAEAGDETGPASPTGETTEGPRRWVAAEGAAR